MPAKQALGTERHPRFLSLFFKAIKQPVWTSQADLEITLLCAAELTSLWPHADSSLFCKLWDSEATVCICPQRTCKHGFICCSITSQFMLFSQRVVACCCLWFKQYHPTPAVLRFRSEPVGSLCALTRWLALPLSPSFLYRLSSTLPHRLWGKEQSWHTECLEYRAPTAQ